MVGVGGKSTACTGCRRRRIKCDEARPECKRCQRIGLSCGGYGHPLTFINQGPGLMARAKFHHTSNLSVQLPGSVALLDSISPAISLSAFQENIFFSFAQGKLFPGSLAKDTCIWDLVDVVKASSSYHAVRAVTATFFGNINCSAHARYAGNVAYGKTLQSLNRELSNSQQQISETVQRSIIFLCIYELLALNSSSAWLRHVAGIGRTIELRGPRCHQNGIGRMILESSRVMIAVEAIIKKKRTFLAKGDWKRIPWSSGNCPKSLFNHIQDILCDIPGLLEAAELVNEGPNEFENVKEYATLCKTTRDTIDRACSWRVVWEQSNPRACYEVSASGLHSDGNGEENSNPFATVLYFSNLGLANEIALFGTVLLLLGRLGSRLFQQDFSLVVYAQIPSQLQLTNPLVLPGHNLREKDIADEICRCVNYHLLATQDYANSLFILFPLEVARKVYDPNGREAKWIQNVLTWIANNHGIELSRALV